MTHHLDLAKVCEDRLDLWVVGSRRSALAQVAGGACQHEVGVNSRPAPRLGKQMVDVEYPTICIEKLQDASFGHFGSGSPELAVLADPSISLSDEVPQTRRDISGVAHSTKVSTLVGIRRAA